jgi:hypothetical protein
MLKTVLVLTLLLLQALCALPGKVRLCFEAGGAFCCVEGGEQSCDCNQESSTCQEHHGSCCGHSPAAPAKEKDECSDRATASEQNDDAHRHVVLSDPFSESLCTERTDFKGSFEEIATLQFFIPVELQIASHFKCVRLYCEGPAEALPFSLIARASTVLRC